MKIRYVGKLSKIQMPEIGIFEKGKIVEVPLKIAKGLLKTGEFEQVKKKEVKKDGGKNEH